MVDDDGCGFMSVLMKNKSETQLDLSIYIFSAYVPFSFFSVLEETQ